MGQTDDEQLDVALTAVIACGRVDVAGPVELMGRLILLNSVGLILAVTSTLRPKLKYD